MSTDTTVSPLRRRMIEDMAARKLGRQCAEKPHPQLQALRRVPGALARHGDS